MPEDVYAAYREYLTPGSRVEIGVPLAGGGVFRDWAVISEAAEDELLAQMSRDLLPAKVRVDVDTILDVALRAGSEVYTCSGIVTEKQNARVLRIRLFGTFTLSERRQYFRIEVALRLQYAHIAGSNLEEIERDLAHRREIEQMRLQGYDDFVIAARKANYTPAGQLEWREIFDADLNLSGGGFSLTFPEPVQAEELLAMNIFLPLVPPRQVQCVAKAVHVRPRHLPNGQLCYRVGGAFVLLEERERDLLFQHISASQLAVLRTVAERRDYPEPHPHGVEEVSLSQVVGRALLALIFLILAYYLVRYFIAYSRHHPPSQIQQTYEKSIKHYRHEDK